LIDGLCYVRGCSGRLAPPPNPAFLCDAHLRAARSARMIERGGYAWGACLAGCTGFCEKGKWRQSGPWREFVQSSECEHIPAHLLRLACKSRSAK
jgi:hypothetical protein